VTLPVASKNTGPCNASSLNFSVDPDAMLIVVKLKMLGIAGWRLRAAGLK
jgi:hypothetical protein